MHSLRRALAELLASVNADPLEPQELARRFKLDKTLTWRISRVIREEDVWEAVGHIPGRPSIRALVERLTASGAPEKNANAVREAMESFEQFVSRHSGDRETLEIMVGMGNRPSSSKRMEQFRKQGFQANSAAWGVQARVQFCCHFMGPSSEPGLLDMASVTGMVDLRRLRPNVPWAVGKAQAWEDLDPEIDARPQPLARDAGPEGVPIIPQFCTQPLPKLRSKATAGGSRRFEIVDGELGYTGAATIVLGWKWARSASIYESVPNDTGEHGVHLWTPVELVIHDMLVHHSLGFAMNPTAAIYSDLPGGPEYPAEGPEVGRMAIPEDVTDLGSRAPNLTAPEIPGYMDIVRFGVEQMGWKLDDFHGFRHRVRYPTIPTVAMFKHGLLPRA